LQALQRRQEKGEKAKQEETHKAKKQKTTERPKDRQVAFGYEASSQPGVPKKYVRNTVEVVIHLGPQAN